MARSPEKRSAPEERSISARLASARLTPALAQVADLLLTDPEAVAFGTVASVAEQGGTSAPSVVRLAHLLGFDGFAELRDVARRELSMRLATDVVRARVAVEGDQVERVRNVEHANIDATLDAVDGDTLAAVVAALDTTRKVWVLPSSQTVGVAIRCVDQLRILGSSAELLDGSEFRLMSSLAGLRRGDVLWSMDVPRHEHALVRIQRHAVERGALPVVLTGPPSTALEHLGGHVLGFATSPAGAFDSLVGLTVLVSLLIDELTARRRGEATSRLAGLERTWTGAGLFET
ncbi:MAG: MurR/RpiR family transcriptional regulator [Actinomycetota bacterium]|nr:MurR/RpiR family transcriptional regulator [Actinomycetota bacterium]